MSTSAPSDLPPQNPTAPTTQDAQAIFDRAAQAAERAETAAQRLEQAQGAATQETEARFPGMPAEVVKQIADQAAQTVVSALNAQYELQARPAAGPASSTPAEGTTPPAGETPAGGDTPPPVKRSIADRILNG